MDSVIPIRPRDVDRQAHGTDAPSQMKLVRAELDAMYAIADAMEAIADDRIRARILDWAARLLDAQARPLLSDTAPADPHLPAAIASAAPPPPVSSPARPAPPAPDPAPAGADSNTHDALSFDGVESLFGGSHTGARFPDSRRPSRRRRFRPRLVILFRWWS